MLAAHAGYDSNTSVKEKKHKSRRWYLSKDDYDYFIVIININWNIIIGLMMILKKFINENFCLGNLSPYRIYCIYCLDYTIHTKWFSLYKGTLHSKYFLLMVEII